VLVDGRRVYNGDELLYVIVADRLRAASSPVSWAR
jgi:hypothetical protein